MNFIQGILSETIINALGYTILHSLWQGLLVGGLLYLLLFLAPNLKATIRYNLSVFSLVLLLGLSVLTFYLYTNGEIQTVSTFDNPSISVSDEHEASASVAYESKSLKALFISITGLISDALPLSLPVITSIWLLGVLIISLRMTGGLIYIHRLRNSARINIPDILLSRFENLCRLMKIRRKPGFYESAIIKVPSIIGYFKPIILLPVSAVTFIPVEQLEAIVAHELAHIRRHDWLVNIFQSVMEALYFYHPVVWYIQSTIRKERENCCDDIALNYSNGQLVYIKALASINEVPASTGFPLLAINSEKNWLLNRVLRILKQGKMKTNLKDKLLAGILVVSAATIILLSTGGRFISFSSLHGSQSDTTSDLPPDPTLISDATDPVPVVLPVVQPGSKLVIHVTPSGIVSPVTAPDPITSKDDTTLRIKDNVIQRTIFSDGKEMDMKLKIEKGEVVDLTIDGKQIPKKDWGKYQAEIDETLADVRKLEEDLTKANEHLSQMNMEKLKEEIEYAMQEAQAKINEIDVEAMVQRLENIKLPEIDEEKLKQEIDHAMKEIQEIDIEKIRSELEFKMQALCEEMKEIELPDADKLKQELEKARQEIEQIDQEKIRAEVQEAMKEIQIDKEKLQREIEKSMQELKEVDADKLSKELENDKIKMDEMLKEIDKLELDKK